MFKLLQTFSDKLIREIRKPDNESEAIATKLSDLRLEISSLMAGVEPDFVKLGETFQSIYSDTEVLTDIVISTAGLASDASGGIKLTNISEFSEKSLYQLKSFHENIENSLSILDSGKIHLKNLSRMCAQTDKFSVLLNVIAINIALESNRYDKSRSMFGVFVDEVKELSEKIRVVSENLHKDSESTHTRQKKSIDEITVSIEKLARFSGDAEKAVSKASGKIEELIEASLSSLDLAKNCSEAISRNIGQIVMAIQFHDIVRQQIEHVAEAISDAENLFNDNSGNGITYDFHDSVSKAYPILRVQNAQIKKAISEIDEAYEKILKAFNDIESKISELVHGMSGTVKGFTHKNNAENPFKVVISCLSNLRDLISQAYVLNGQMEGVVSDASHSASGLLKHVDHVQKISLDLQIKALNAIIKAAHLGDLGLALEVLAQEVTITSNESGRFAKKVVKIINSVAGLASKLEKDALDQNGSENDSAAESFEKGIRKISDSYISFTDNTSVAADMAHNLQQAIESAKSAISFMPLFSKKMSALLKKSEEMLLDESLWVKDQKQKKTDSAETFSRYTMESERMVHLSILGDSAAPVDGDSQTLSIEYRSEQVESTDARDNNIEMFPDEPATSNDNIDFFDDEDTDSGDIVLFESDEPTENQSIELFGDNAVAENKQTEIFEESGNIELFEEMSVPDTDNIELFNSDIPDEKETAPEEASSGSNEESSIQSNEFDDNIELF